MAGEGKAPELSDPAQEEQGLNSVFDSDKTLELVRKYNDELKIKN
jgi:hypothetical protein